MAIEVGTTSPFAPVSTGGGSAQSALVRPFPITASEVISIGDVITIVAATGLVLDTNTAQGTNLVVGIAVQPLTAPASVTDNDVLLIALATPGTLFFGHLVGDATTDHATPAYADIDPTVPVDTIELTVQGYPAIDVSDTIVTSGVRIHQFAKEQLQGKPFKSGSGGTNNARVTFSFVNSIFS